MLCAQCYKNTLIVSHVWCSTASLYARARVILCGPPLLDTSTTSSSSESLGVPHYDPPPYTDCSTSAGR